MPIFISLNQRYALPEIRCPEVPVVSHGKSSHWVSLLRQKVGEITVQGAVQWPVLGPVVVTRVPCQSIFLQCYPCCGPLSQRRIALGADVLMHRNKYIKKAKKTPPQPPFH